MPVLPVRHGQGTNGQLSTEGKRGLHTRSHVICYVRDAIVMVSQGSFSINIICLPAWSENSSHMRCPPQ